MHAKDSPPFRRSSIATRVPKAIYPDSDASSRGFPSIKVAITD